MTNKNRREIKKIDQASQVVFGGEIMITGNVTGSSIGGDSVYASNIAGGNVNVYQVSQERDDLVEYMRNAINQETLSSEEKLDAIEAVELVQKQINLGYDTDEKILNYLLRSIKGISSESYETLGKKILAQENISPQTKHLIKGML